MQTPLLRGNQIKWRDTGSSEGRSALGAMMFCCSTKMENIFRAYCEVSFAKPSGVYVVEALIFSYLLTRNRVCYSCKIFCYFFHNLLMHHPHCIPTDFPSFQCFPCGCIGLVGTRGGGGG